MSYSMLSHTMRIKKPEERIKTALMYSFLKAIKSAVEEGADANKLVGSDFTYSLHWAVNCRAGVDVIQYLVDKECDTDGVDSRGNTLYHYCAGGGHLPALNLLLERKALTNTDINATAKTARGGETPILESVGAFYAKDWSSSKDSNSTKIPFASLEQRKEVAEKLLSLGAMPLIPKNAKQENAFDVLEKPEDKEWLLEASKKAIAGQGCNLHVQAFVNDLDGLKKSMEDKDFDPVLFEKTLDGSKWNIVHLIAINAYTPNQIVTGKSNTTTALEILNLAKTKNVDFLKIINAADTSGRTPAIVASMSGNVPVMTFLIENGADTSMNMSNGSSCIGIASECGHNDLVDYLIPLVKNVDGRDSKNNTLLHHAVLNNDLEKVKSLVEGKKIDINVTGFNDLSPLHIACLKGHIQIIEYLTSDTTCEVNCKAAVESGYDSEDEEEYITAMAPYPIHMTALGGTPALQALLSCKRVDVNTTMSTGATLLGLFPQNEDIVDLLTDNGADPNVSDENGVTPLHTCCTASAVNPARILIAHGANVNALCDSGDFMKSKDQTPLHYICCRHYCAEKRSAELTKLLIEKGANVNAQDSNGSTPLHRLFTYFGTSTKNPMDDEEILVFQHIARGGADFDILDKEGISAFQYAIMRYPHVPFKVIKFMYDISPTSLEKSKKLSEEGKKRIKENTIDKIERKLNGEDIPDDPIPQRRSGLPTSEDFIKMTS